MNKRALGVSGIVSEEQVEIANDKIMQELEEIVSNGFSDNAMQAALHKMEFEVSSTLIEKANGSD